MNHIYNPSVLRIVQRIGGGLLAIALAIGVAVAVPDTRGAPVAIVVFAGAGLGTLIQFAAAVGKPALEVTEEGITCRLGQLEDRRQLAWDDVTAIGQVKRGPRATVLRARTGGKMVIADRWFVPTDPSGHDPEATIRAILQSRGLDAEHRT